jgi:class 3 adenylate cyclase/pimeloyl-ACP methyl ester carboxylesterase
MNEPRIQYARTSDGVNIAYYAIGDGQPLVQMPAPPWSHIQLEWSDPRARGWCEQLARKWTLVKYDSRGSGLSQPGPGDYSLDAHLLDLEAVVDALRLEKFALLGVVHSGPVAVAYAAANRERLSHLILWCAYARGSDYTRSQQVQAIRALIEKDWDVYTQTVAHATLGWAAGEPARQFAAYLRGSATSEVVQSMLSATSRFDATQFLAQVETPTLVLYRAHISWLPARLARELATQIKRARLAVLEGESGVPFLGDSEPVVRAIQEFLGEGDEPLSPYIAPETTAIILFVDIANSTSLTERLGDRAFREKARELDGALRERIRNAGGTAIEGKLLGDGVLAVFTSARQAIECALACRAASANTELPLHLGVHAGDVICEGNNVYGGAVNIASRIADASAAGEVLVSDTVRNLARTSAGVDFEDRGEHELKGVSDAQRLFAVVPAE